MRRFRASCLAPLLALSLVLPAATAAAGEARPPETPAAEARRLAEALQRGAALPGFSVAIGLGKDIVWSEGFGLANLETPVAVRADTRFRAGSVSKVLTAGLLARLEARGVLELDAPIQKWLPDYPDKGAPITLRLLAGHLAGTRHYVPKDGELDARHWDTLGEALTIFRDDNLVAPPGERYNYSTFGYTLIGAAIEAATKKPFAEVLREELTGPLGLRDTGLDQRRELIPGRATFYDRGGDGQLRNIAPDDPSYKWPGGGVLTTSEDLVRYGLAVLGDYLTPAQRQAYFASQRNQAGEATGVGIGWRIGKDWRGRLVYHHAGTQAGARAVLILYPEQGLAVSVMTNLGSTPAGIEPTAQMLAEPFLAQHEPGGEPPGEVPLSEVAPPGGPYIYRGTFRGEQALGTLNLFEEGPQRRGGLSTPTPLALAFRLQGQPAAATLEVVGSWADGPRHALVVATPFGLLPLILEKAPQGWQGKLAMGGASLDILAQPLTNLVPIEEKPKNPVEPP